MSCQVSHVEYLSGELRITRENILQVVDRLEVIPEAGFIADFLWDCRKCRKLNPADLPDGPVPIATPGFQGEFSRDGMEACEEWLWGLTTGSADILVTWEGGDQVSGRRVVDGKVSKHAVIRSLGLEITEEGSGE